jgi:hypothetical protein
MEAIKTLDTALYRLNNRADDVDQGSPRRTKRGGYIWALENLNGLAYWDTEAKGWALFTAHPTHGQYLRVNALELVEDDSDAAYEATPEEADAAEDFLASHVGRMARFEHIDKRRSSGRDNYEFVPALLQPATVFCNQPGYPIQRLASISLADPAKGVKSLTLTNDPESVRYYPDKIYYCVPNYKDGLPKFEWQLLGKHAGKEVPAGFNWEEPHWATYKCPSLYGKF